MIIWGDIIESHVVRTFREISYKWWTADVRFFDKRFSCIDNNTPLQNPLCRLIHSTTKGKKKCNQNCSNLLKKTKTSKGHIKYKCHAGLLVDAIPVILKGNYAGAMVISGILSSKKEPKQNMYMYYVKMYKCIDEITKFGLEKYTVERAYNSLKTINEHNEAFAVDFMELVMKDVIDYSNQLYEKEEIIKRQSNLLERVYNEKYDKIIGKSPALKKVFDTLDILEGFESTTLIEGESGTGKELIAAAIHYNSTRKDKQFIKQNCSVIHETLLNSELFGHEKGSFTGATSDKKGMFELADGGTLFMDEIGDMTMEVQAKLLRVLEDGTFYSVGGTEPKKVDIRVIVATNKELKTQVEKGLFRKDLYYRINTIRISMPPLRQRKEDIVLIVDYFLGSFAKINKMEKKKPGRGVFELLMAYDWPGNIRELENTIEHMIILSGKSKSIERKHMPENILAASCSETYADAEKKGPKLRDALKSLEKEMIRNELKKSNWKRDITSKGLGISRTSLNEKITQFKLQPDT
ncbi:MAG: sigma 54-interacting transcriptional regulator [Candidatus Scalindua sp.]